MHTTEIILGLLTAVAALAWLASRLRVPYPILLVLGGLGLSFVPHLPRIELNPEHVFLLFLPPILYYAATQTSWRDFRANLRPITLLAVGLVLFCTVAVAYAAHQLVPGLSWASAFVLGAIISPPDAVAATAILQRLRVPRRVLTVLEGESLINDATALVTYQFAVAAAVTGAFSPAGAMLKFVVAGGGGVIFGLLVGIVVVWVRPRIRDSAVENVVALLIPYIAYLPADRAGLSGVLAVVTCGIYLSRRIGRITTAQVRLRTFAVWEAFIFLLNGVVFILIGLQISRIWKDLSPSWLWYATVISIVAILARMAWVFPAAYVPRWIVPGLRQRDPVPAFSFIFLIAWTQMRGVVSLAAALALPLTMPRGDRDLILFITFGVILITLVGQGVTLPAMIRALKLDVGPDETEDEEVTARYLAALAAIERLDALGAANGDAAAMLQRLRATYDDRLSYYSRLMNPDGHDLLTCETGEQAIHQAIAAQRDMLLRLRDQGTIGDDVLRLVEQELDHEESTIR
ncbi:MAG TPA: Na+/H+ antiporter [Tepidisphaeraceae bacterium]|nr:Na+/H+ antiporter [Tepidisphaeraceae bacterium]